MEVREPGKSTIWRTDQWSFWRGWFPYPDERYLDYYMRTRKEDAWKLYTQLLTEPKVIVIHDSEKHADAESLTALGFPNLSNEPP